MRKHMLMVLDGAHQCYKNYMWLEIVIITVVANIE